MNTKSSAIVLLDKNKKLSLLSKKEGHFQVFFFDRKQIHAFSPGTVISYSVAKTNKGYTCLDTVTIEKVPFEWAAFDINFLHCLLEVCYFFVPVNSFCVELFFIVTYFYKNFTKFTSLFLQKIIVCKMLAHLGIIPEDREVQKYARFFLTIDVDKLDTINLQLNSEQLLDMWILWCIKTNSQGKWLKVLPLLIKSE